MTLRKQKDTENGKRKFWIPLCGKLAFEKAMDLSSDYGINCVLGRCHICEGIGSNSKSGPVRDMKAYRGSRGTATFIVTSALRGSQ
jgi:hypothetical protein